MSAQPRPAKTALVTGAARRIGRAIALELARDGFSIAVHYRHSQAEAMSLAKEITALGPKAVALKADLASIAECQALIAQCTEKIGAPCCLVNNASEFLLDGIDTLDEATWNLHQNINLKAPVFLAQAMSRHLPQNVEGNIINIVDQRVWKLTPDFFSYTISKAGLWTATRTLAQALAPRIRVNAIGPGPVFQSVHQTPQDFAAEQDSTLLKHGPSPAEIANAVRFILATPSMTGQMIALDSGQHLG
jgi:NAD(P)-dependent dehydrogenase (short-subunit alcohol dehydrogenase family)